MAEENNTPEAISANNAPVENTESLMSSAAPVESKDLISSTEEAKPSFDFREHVPEEFKDASSLKDIKDFDGLIKSFVNKDSMIGKKFEDLSPEDVSKYYGKMGRPDDASKYDLDVEGVGKEADLDWFKVSAHKAGLSNDQAKEVLSNYLSVNEKMVAEKQEAAAKSHSNQVAEVKEMFGIDFQENVAKANEAAKFIGGQDLLDAIKDSGMGNNPHVIKAFHEVSKMMGEHKSVSGESKPTGASTESIQRSINELRSSKLLTDYNDPKAQKQAQTKLLKLYEQRANSLAQ